MRNRKTNQNQKPSRLDPDGLSARQRAFVNAYVTDPNDKAAAAVAAGYSKKGARQKGYALSTSPKIQGAIKAAMVRAGIVDQVALTQEIIANHLAAIRVKATDIWLWDGVDLKIKPFSDMPQEAILTIEGMSRKSSEFGYEDKIEITSKLPHLKALTQLIQAQTAVKVQARADMAGIVKAVLDGTMTATQAALTCDMKGILIPESIRLILAKEKPVDPDPDKEVPEVTAEELEAKARAKLAEVDGQRDTFLPARQAEVRDLKEAHKARETFAEPGLQ